MKKRILYAASLSLATLAVAVLLDMSRAAPVPERQPDEVASSTPTAVDSREIARGNTGKKEVIFTFDGGGTIESGDKILEVLAKHHVKGTFFLTGKMVEAHPDLVKRIAAQGNEIFNHTYDHQDLTRLSDDKIAAELDGMDKALAAITGSSTKPYFRAPYGARNARVLVAAEKAGYRSVYWTVDGHDWMDPKTVTADQVEKRILSSVAPGVIYLMHVGDAITGAILDDVFTKIESQGYAIVPITQGVL